MGKLTVPAIFAAAIEPRIGKLILAGGISSYRELAVQEEYRETFANFVPGVLLHTDLPQVIAGIAPRAVVRIAAGDWGVKALTT